MTISKLLPLSEYSIYVSTVILYNIINIDNIANLSLYSLFLPYLFHFDFDSKPVSRIESS